MSNQIELRQMHYFLAVAEELHFRKAAEKLFISQPGLSRQIKQMEDNLGIILFERNNRNVTLTQAGKYLQKELTINLKVLDIGLYITPVRSIKLRPEFLDHFSISEGFIKESNSCVP